MKTTIKLIELRMELTRITLESFQGKINDYSRLIALKHSYYMMKPIYKAVK